MDRPTLSHTSKGVRVRMEVEPNRLVHTSLDTLLEVGNRLSKKCFQAAEWTYMTEGIPEGTIPPGEACAMGSARG